jgi:hypothetical protein
MARKRLHLVKPQLDHLISKVRKTLCIAKPKSNRRRQTRSSRKNRKNNRASSSLAISGPFGSKISLPISRLPFVTLGAAENLSVGASTYPNRLSMCAPVTPFEVSVVSGVPTAAVTAINPTTVVNGSATLVNNWSAYAKIFEEYCLVGFRLEVRYQTTAFATGVILITLDEKDGTTPTLLQYDKPHIELMTTINSGVDFQMIEWVPSDLSDLQWTSTSSTVTPIWMKYFSAFNSSSSGNILITGTLSFNFRGFTAD